MWFSLSCLRFSCDIHALFALSAFSLGFYFSAQLCLHFHHLSPLALYFISVICVVTFLIFFFFPFFLSVPVGTSHSRNIGKENLPLEVHLRSLSSVLVLGHRDLRMFYFGLFPVPDLCLSVALAHYHL